ncbi:MAG: polysaccharide deacetylase family protein [Nitrososphaerota archaeon]|jgi:peptidoglycan/xylan/chitin deacetylase (PgdA/CDA1 family)|nr:polysaccharide deacetylase family protein [Nitrososphaerota archaeon]
MPDNTGSIDKKLLAVVMLASLLTVALLIYAPLQSSPINSQTFSPETYIYQPNVPQEGQRVICIVFDDGWLNQYTNALPILDEYGFKATFSIITAYPNKISGYMNWNQIQTLHNHGHAIGSHTVDHFTMDSIDASAVEYQLAQSKQDLLEHGINTPLFVYPEGKGAGDSNIEKLVQQHYSIARSIDHGRLDMSQPFDPYRLPAFSIEKSTTFEMFTRYVDQANDSTIVIIYYHHVSDGSTYTSVTTKDFATQMQYLHDNGFTIQTLNQLFTVTTT